MTRTTSDKPEPHALPAAATPTDTSSPPSSPSPPSSLRRACNNVAAGTVAGIAVCLVGHPFDTLKVRLQTQPVRTPLYNGLADCFFKTIKWEGIGGLYKGVASPLVGQMFFRAILFTSNQNIITYLAGTERAGQRLSHHEYFVSGACTGFVASFAEGPIDLLKTKMQVQILQRSSPSAAAAAAGAQYRNVFHAASTIVKQQGPLALYQGLPATWMRNVPAFSIYFGFYELFRDAFTPEGGSVNQLPAWAMFTSGGCAGFLYWFLTYPTDVIKSSLQSDHSDKTKRRFRGIVDCAQKLYREEGGVPRFFRGFLPCLMRSIPANATMLFVLEKARLFLS